MAKIGKRHFFEAVYEGGNAQKAIIRDIVYAQTEVLFRDHTWIEHDGILTGLKKYSLICFSAEIAYYPKQYIIDGRTKHRQRKGLKNAQSVYQLS